MNFLYGAGLEEMLKIEYLLILFILCIPVSHISLRC